MSNVHHRVASASDSCVSQATFIEASIAARAPLAATRGPRDSTFATMAASRSGGDADALQRPR